MSDPMAVSQRIRFFKYRHHLSAKGRKLFKTRQACVESIEQRSSKDSLVLQLLDVTLGALTAKKNNRVLNEHKTRVMNFVHERNEGRDLDHTSNTAYNSFNVWNFVPYPGDEDDEEQMTLPALP